MGWKSLVKQKITFVIISLFAYIAHLMLSAKQTVFATRSSTLSQSVNLNNMCPPWFDNNHIQGENYGILASILSSPVPRAFTPKAHHLRFVHPRLKKISSRIITFITIHHHHPLSPSSPIQHPPPPSPLSLSTIPIITISGLFAHV